MKICRVCKKEKSLNEFSINKSKKSGINDECKECQKEYFRNYYKKNKEKHIKSVSKVTKTRKNFVLKIKKESGCVKCGYNKNPIALQFHHIDPSTKKFNISEQLTCCIEKLKQEIDKCVILCANCHIIEHHTNKSLFNKFNTKKSKKTKKCKCGKEIFKQSFKCRNCYNKDRIVKNTVYKTIETKCPTKEILEKLVWEKPSSKIAEEYGVSDRCIGKWCTKYGIKKPQRGYWTKLNKEKK